MQEIVKRSIEELNELLSKEKKNYTLTFDEILQNIEDLKTIGSLEFFLTKKFKNEKK